MFSTLKLSAQSLVLQTAPLPLPIKQTDVSQSSQKVALVCEVAAFFLVSISLTLAPTFTQPSYAQGMQLERGLRLPSGFNAERSAPAGSAVAPNATDAANVSRTLQADHIVAVVNTEPVTFSDVRLRMQRVEDQLRLSNQAVPPRAELQEQVLERLIQERAQIQLAKDNGLKVEPAVLEQAMVDVARQNNLGLAEYQAQVTQRGGSWQRLVDDVHDEILIARLREREVENRVSVSDAEINQWLKDQGQQSQSGLFEMNLAQILVAVPENANAQTVAQAQAKAQQIYQRVQAGESFPRLASELSDAPAPVRQAGGEMGMRRSDQYPELFAQAVANAERGQIVGPVRSGAGFHVLLVIEKRRQGLDGFKFQQTQARHILLKIDTQRTEAQAREQLAVLKRQIETGFINFAQAARQTSQDGSAEAGGDLGWTRAGVFVPEFEQAMNALALNAVSAPVRSRFGMHLIQVQGRREATPTPQELRVLATNALREAKFEEVYLAWAKEVRDQAYVEMREAQR